MVSSLQDAFDRWYCCNDSYVSVSTLQEVLSEKAYILFFSRTKQRPRTRVDVVVNGSKSHELNGNKTSIMQKSGSLDKSVCTEDLNHHPESNNSTNGSYVEKPVSMKISTNHLETNSSTKNVALNGIKTPKTHRPDSMETASIKELSDNPPGRYNSITSVGSSCCNPDEVHKLGALLEPVNIKESSNHLSQVSSSTNCKVDQGLSSRDRMFGDSLSTNKIIPPGSIKNAVNDKVSKEENGCKGTSVTTMEKEKTGLLVIERNGMRKKSDVQIMKRGLFSFRISSRANGPIAVDSTERTLPEVNGFKMATASEKSQNCLYMQNSDVIGSSNNSCMKRKIEDDRSCILLAGDDESRAKVEAFKELYVYA